MRHVFISYARKDGLPFAEKLDSTLPHEGFMTWRDKREIDPTQDFTAEIEKAIEASSYIVACITPDVRRENSFVRREIAYAQVMNKPILVARFHDVTPPIAVVNHTWIDFFKGWETGYQQLCELLGIPSEHFQAPAPSETPDPHKPYLEMLYRQIVRYLDKTVFSILPGQASTPLISLDAQNTPDAVAATSDVEALPMAFFDMAGINEPTQPNYGSLHDAFSAHKGRLLLLGDPGSGKTTTLMAFARDAVVRRLDDITALLPTLAPIAAWDANAETPLAEWLGDLIPALQSDLPHLLETGRTLLLLDGLDELGEQREAADDRGGTGQTDPRLRFSAILPANNQIIVTCRVQEYGTLGEKLALNGAITLKALNDGQMQTYLSDLPVLWSALQRDAQLREVARTPLLLSLFTYAFAGLDLQAEALHTLEQGALRDKIFETYVSRRYEHERRKPNAQMPYSLTDLLDILGKLAAQDVVGFFFGAPENILVMRDFDRVVDAHKIAEFVEFAIRLNLLISIDAQMFRFAHLMLRDYFAFRYGSVGGNIGRYQFSYLALGRLGDLRALDLLIGFLNDDSLSVYARSEAATALGWLRDKRATPHLIAMIGSEAVEVRQKVTRALARIADPAAIEPLIAALKDVNPVVRGNAVRALGSIGDTRAIPALEAALNDKTVTTFSLERGELRVSDLATEALASIKRLG